MISTALPPTAVELHETRSRTSLDNGDHLREEHAKLSSMLDNIPINVLMADRGLKLVYMNPASRKTLKQLEKLLPRPVDLLVGESIDIFHTAPERQRKLLDDPRNLPHQARIKLGSETLDLLVSPIYDATGQYTGPMVTWSVITDRVNLADEVMRVVSVVNGSSGNLQAGTKTVAAAAEETARQSQIVAAAGEEAAKNVETVAAATEELTASITEIARHVQNSARVSGEAVKEAESANSTIHDLGTASAEIGQVIKVITSIAQQTNLLALNATIEAARAGEAGKGFAVVANEVKELARQTAKATEEIGRKIDAIQSSTRIAIASIESIGGIIGRMNEISTTIAAAVEEQSAATAEISRNVAEAARGTTEVSNNITGVSQAAEESGRAASQMQDAAGGLVKEANHLEAIVRRFVG